MRPPAKLTPTLRKGGSYTKSKPHPCRRLALLFCTLLFFCALLPTSAHADYGSVTTGYLYPYFQTFGSNGTWKDIQTPSHWIVETGEVAYCLQTEKDTPYGGSYSTVDGSVYYSQRVLTGLQAILENGYPVSTGGYAANEARYATANAIRFWLAENYCDGVPQYLNLNANGQWIRGRYGYEGLYSWALELVQLARNQAVSSGSTGALSFNPSTLELTDDGSGYFTGTTTVSTTLSRYDLWAPFLPSDAILSGYNANNGDRLTIQIPTSYEGETFYLSATGDGAVTTARLFFWQPDASNQQRVVSCVLDTQSMYLDARLTITTSSLTPQTGSVQITKTGEDGAPLSGVSFTLSDENQNPVSSGVTDGNGVLTFNDLPPGSYFYAETATLAGYVLDSALYPVSVTEGGQCVTVTVTNNRAQGSIQVLKTDENGAPLAGVHFVLKDSGGTVLSEGGTDGSGALLLFGLPLGDYTVQETATLPGYALDSTEHALSITENGQTVTVTATNTIARGKVSILKTDAETGQPLAGVHFVLTDSGGAIYSEGNTDTNGALTFHDLLLGTYCLQETATLPGYALEETPISVEVTANGQTVELSLTNTPIRGNLKLVKRDACEGTPLSGAGFRLYDSGGQQLEEGYTDENGELSFSDLPCGSYSYREFCPPKGYLLDDMEYTFSVTEHGATVTQERLNLRRPGTLEVRKQDQNGQPLPGAVFLLEYSTDSGTSWTPVFSRNGDDVQAGGCTSPTLLNGQLGTGDSGSVRFTGLRADGSTLYRLTETKAPDGHSLLGSSLYVGTLPVEISGSAEDSETVDGVTCCYTLYVTATDDPLFRLPETGGSGFFWLPLFPGGMTILFKITMKRKETDT